MNTPNAATMRRGARVETTGAGKTARWPHFVGTVLRVRAARVYVQWDYVQFANDEMEAHEVRLLGTAHQLCPCAQCRHG